MVTRSELFEKAERLKRSSRLGPLLDLCDAILSLECDGSDRGLSSEISSLRQALSARDNEIATLKARLGDALPIRRAGRPCVARKSAIDYREHRREYMKVWRARRRGLATDLCN